MGQWANDLNFGTTGFVMHLWDDFGKFNGKGEDTKDIFTNN